MKKQIYKILGWFIGAVGTICCVLLLGAILRLLWLLFLIGWNLGF